jgi:putative transposase
MNNILEQTRWIYNETLALRKNAWEYNKKSISLYDTHKSLWKPTALTMEAVTTKLIHLFFFAHAF